jgi:hypothetical protein
MSGVSVQAARKPLQTAAGRKSVVT